MAIVIEHTRSRTGWIFECPVLPAVCGGGRSYAASCDTAEHAMRVHLQTRLHVPMATDTVQALVEHHRNEAPSPPE